MSAKYGQIIKDGLWENNGVLCMLLGMCPTMAMTGTATNGFGMGIATAVVMAASNLMVAMFRNYVTHEVRIPVYILIVAANVTFVDLAMNAWMHELYKVLGLFIPLIVSNCLPLARLEAFAAKEPVLPSFLDGLFMGLATAVVMAASNLMVAMFRNYVTHEVRIPVYILIVAANVTFVDLAMNAWMHELYKVLGLFIPLIVSNCLPLARLEAFAAKEPVMPSLMDGIFMGLGFTLALTLIGAMREIIGSGTLFADASLLLGPAFKFMELKLLPPETNILMMILPPGGFLAAGLLVVFKRLLDIRAGKEISMGGAHSVG